MKIAIVAGAFLPVPPQKYGGTERVIYYLIKGLQELGHEVTLFATGDSQVDCRLIPIHDTHLSFGKTTTEQKLVLEEETKINRYTHQLLNQMAGEFDVIHSHGFDLIDFSAVPAVTTLHGKFTLDVMEYYEHRRHLNYISISNNQRDSFPDLTYVGTAYNGLDPEDFPVIAQPDDYVCFIGRFDREKNPHLAIKLAINSGVRIKFAGKIDFQGIDYFKEEVEPLLEHPLVEHLGELGMADKIKLISNARVNLHPTGFREPFGLTVLEAAYCGTPTMAIAQGSMPELIEDGRTGFLVEDFAEAYHYLEEAYKLDRHYIATRARTLFNYRNMAKQYVAAYQQAIENYRAVKPARQPASLGPLGSELIKNQLNLIKQPFAII